jgi:hypothetical protein
MEERDDPRELEARSEDSAETSPSTAEEVLERPPAPPPRRASGGRAPPSSSDDSAAGLRERQLAWNRERVRIEVAQAPARALRLEPDPPAAVPAKPKSVPGSGP